MYSLFKVQYVFVTRLYESSQTGEHASWEYLLPSQ